MKILILSDSFPPYIPGGAEKSIFNLAQVLRQRGHQIFVITTCRKKSAEENLDYQGLKVFRIFADFHDRWRSYLSLYNPQTVEKVTKLMKEIKPDIVHANNIHWYLSYHCLKIAKKYSKKVFLTARDLMLFNYGKLATKRYLERLDAHTSWLNHLNQAKIRYNPFRNIIIRRYLKYVDKVFATSHALKRALAENGIKNVEVVYNGIDVADWQIAPELVEGFKREHDLLGKKVIFFGGRISNLKGLAQIQKAIAIVKKEIPETVLLMAGSEGIGWLHGAELTAAFTAADIVVTPSVYLDPFNRTNIEAMACKKPVIGTSYGGTPEIVQDGATGYIVNPLNVEVMAQKIIDLLKNPDKAKKFGEAGYERVKTEFSLDKCVDQMINWYQKI